MKHTKKYRRRLIAVITLILLILLSLWMFIKASEDEAPKQECYKPYRGNVLGVAGDFCVFTKENADLSEVTADVAVGGNFKAQSFANYETQWSFYEENDLKFVNLNSYIRGKYENGKYTWQAKRTKDELTCKDGTEKGIYDCGNNHGKANLYIYTGECTDNDKNICEDSGSPNQCKINGQCYENTQQTDNGVTYNAYNVKTVDYEFIDFDKEFKKLSELSSNLIENVEIIGCEGKDGNHTFTYEMPDEEGTVIINLRAEDFFDSNKCDIFNITGLTSSKKIVINVDCTNCCKTQCPVTPRTQINSSPDDWNSLAENILWNFYYPNENDENVQLQVNEIVGTVLAPNIEVNVNGNLDGAVIAKKAQASNAIHGINSNIGWDDINGKSKEETTSVYVEKIWNDGDEESKRPDSVKFKLLADEEEKGIVTLTKDGQIVKIEDKEVIEQKEEKANEDEKLQAWSCKIIELPKYKETSDDDEEKQEIKYTIEEIEVNDNYVSKIEEIKDDEESDNDKDEYAAKYRITNTLLTDIEGEKIWEDSDNNDGYRPETIQVTLYKKVKEDDGTEKEEKVEQKGVDNPITVTKGDNEDNSWLYKFSKVKKYDEDKKEIEYFVKEEPLDDNLKDKYTTSYGEGKDKFKITNKHELETTEFEVTKVWEDKENQDGKRPESVEVTLKADKDDVKIENATVTLNEANNWKHKFTGLQKYKNGEEITYTVDEKEVKGYEKSIEGNTITNTHTPSKIDIEGQKTWNDNDDQDGKRPEQVVVKLFANGEEVKEQQKTVTSENDWKYKFEGVDEYANGKKIEYTIKEDNVDDYQTKIDGYNITNTHEPEKINIPVTKIWDDKDNQDGIRPESITVRVLANGNKVEEQTITEKEDWKYEFKDLPKYEKGKEIIYTIEEDSINKYTTKIDKYNITNTHIPETIEITVTKKWEDSNNQDGKRPEKITVRLFANDEEQVHKDITAENKWEYEFKDLPKYKDGEEIDYTIKEDAVKGYVTTIDGYNITNAHTPEKIKIKGTKKWKDEDDQDGKRPKEINVKLFADGVEIASKTVTENEEWKYEFTDLDKYKDGEEITYTIDEDSVQDYTKKIDGYNLTNIHKPEVIDIKGEKIWEDADNQDGIRPDSVTIRLLADGKEVKDQVKEVNATNNWQYTFKDLPKYKDGKQIEYSVKEDEVTGYKAKIEGYNITNTHEIETVEVVGTKTWKDGENQDGIRPQSITVKLLANGEEKDSVTVTSENKWKYEFKDLPKYKDGKEIVYTVDEEDVPEYKKSIKGYNITNEHEPDKISVEGKKTWADLNNQDGMRPQSITVKLLADGKVVQTKKVTESDNWTYKFENLDKYKKGTEIVYTIDEDEVEDYEKEIHGYNITNRHGVVAGEEVIDVDVTKKWEDKGYEELRPGKVTVNLLANGEFVRTKDITAADKWKCTFKQLEMFDEEGNEIEYSVEEEAIEGYETRIEGFEIINTYIPPVADDKIVIKINKYEKGTTKKLKDAKFELVIKKEDGKDKDNKKKYKEVLKETNTTNSIGQIVLKDLDLEEGTYVLELNEKEAPKGYKKADDSTKIEFTVKEKDGKKVVELKDKNKNVQVEKTTMTIKVENVKEQKKDNTTSKGKLPQTGPGNMVIAGIVIVGFLAVGAIGIFKYREVKY